MSFSKSPTLKKFSTSANNASGKVFFMLVIENYQMLNLAFGHTKTDKIMVSLCKKLSVHGEVFRIQSDEIVIITKINKTPDAKKLKKQIGNLVREFGIEKDADSSAHIAATIDFELAPKKFKPEDFLEILYAKTIGKSSLGNEIEENKSQSKLQMQLANQISKAISEERLSLALQPIIDAKTGKATHHEALLRINDKGQIKSAGSFIPIAEKMGIIYRIDIKVLEMVITLLKKDKNLHLSFNISNLSIGNKQWLKKFFDLITPDIAKRMILEITETAVMQDLKKTSLFVATVQEAGCAVALDDFGSGYTSFRQIRALSLDYVKIDGSLIHDLANNTHNSLLVESLMKFLKGLGLLTIAEHVDGGDTAKLLIKYGIDYMQGNYFGAAKNV